MHWTDINERLPARGLTVLVWYGDGSAGYGLARFDEGGNWEEIGPHQENAPTHWAFLPEPPGAACDDVASAGIKAEIAEGRLVLNVGKERETFALLMQHFIDGSSAIINGERYFVVDIRNEADGEGMASVFYLKSDVG